MFQNSARRKTPRTSFLELEETDFEVMGCPGEAKKVLEIAFLEYLGQKKILLYLFAISFLQVLELFRHVIKEVGIAGSSKITRCKRCHRSTFSEYRL